MNSHSQYPPPPSEGGSSLDELSPEQRDRLTDILDRYLLALENDAPLSQEALLEKHPDLADALTAYFRSLEELHDMAAGFGGSPREEKPAAERETDTAKRIGDFELIREIGRGGMGVVYEARQISLDRQVAVKLLPFAAVLDSKQIARFKHEAQAAAQLHHPNIVPVFAIGVERGVHYYAMQYIDGQPLDQAIEELKASRSRRRKGVGSLWRKESSGNGPTNSAKDSRPLSVPPATTVDIAFGDQSRHDPARETRDDRVALTRATGVVSRGANLAEHFRTVMRLGIQAAEALHAAHDYGVVHRDVKPSNLLLEASGKLWITDFGLARFQRDASLTRSGDLIGTMRYMSPEQAAGRSELVDHRTDIYSLGVTLYELACLQAAFPEERGPALLKQIDSATPPRPRQLRPDMPADLETVILKAMARERDDRYATAQQLADDLRCVLEGQATKAKPPTAIDRLSRWARRRRRTVLAGFAALLFAVIGLTAGTINYARLKNEAESGKKGERHRYEQARQMLDKLGLQIAESLRDVPGADDVHKGLLNDTKRYYLDFIDETKNDPKLQIDAAVTYGKIGDLAAERYSFEESLEAHQKSEAILQALAAADAGDFSAQRQLALAENNVGLALRRLGRMEPAREQFERAIRRDERLLARTPHDGELDVNLALAQCNLGLLEHEMHRPAAASAAFQEGIGRLSRVLEARSHTPVGKDEKEELISLKQKLASAYNNLAAVYLNERPAEAARLHAGALDLLHAASNESSGNLSLRRDLGLTMHNLGSAFSRNKQPEAARAAFEQAIAIREELVRLAPARSLYLSDLATSLNNLGMLESRSNAFGEAKAAFARSLTAYDSLEGQYPSDAAIQSHLGGVYNNLGLVEEKLGELQAAADAFQNAVKHQRAALAQSADLPNSRAFLGKHYESQVRILRKLGRTDEADGKVREAATLGYTLASVSDYDKNGSGVDRNSSLLYPTHSEP